MISRYRPCQQIPVTGQVPVKPGTNVARGMPECRLRRVPVSLAHQRSLKVRI